MAFLFEEMPLAVQEQQRLAESHGYSDFWYHPDYGLYGMAPSHDNIEDERVPVPELDELSEALTDEEKALVREMWEAYQAQKTVE